MTEQLLSFNEVESLAAKAARGAGLGWGHAEDLGRAARWLAAHGFDWPRPLLRLLDAPDSATQAAALVREADRAGNASVRDSWLVESAPLALLVPLFSAASYGRELALLISCVDVLVGLAPDGSARTLDEAPRLEYEGLIAVSAADAVTDLPNLLATQARPSAVPAATLARLSTYASRTFVPASDASRTRGAGSSQSDND